MHNRRNKPQAKSRRLLTARLVGAQHGFTVIELLVTLMIVVALMMVAIPAFVEMTRTQTAGSVMTTFLQDVLAARAEAVKTQLPVAVEAKGGNWRTGWTVYVDNNSNGAFDVADLQIRDQTISVVNYFVGVANGAGVGVTRVAFDRRGGVTAGSINALVCAPGWTSGKDKFFARNLRMLGNGIADTSKGAGSLPGLTCP